jgi:hypothetical protein
MTFAVAVFFGGPYNVRHSAIAVVDTIEEFP